MLSIEQRRAARRAFAREVRRSQTPLPQPESEPASAKANVLGPHVAESPSSSERRPVRVAIVTPVFYVGGAEQWIASLAHWLDPDRAVVTKVIVLFPSAINPVAVSWLPRWVAVVDSRTIDQDGSFDVVITWGLKDLVERISHLTCPTIDVQHGVFLHESWQSPLVAAATRAHELYGTTIVGVNEAVRQNFPEHVRDKVVIIPNGSDPGRVYPLVDRNELRATLGLTPEHKVVVYIGRIAVEKNVQALIDAMEHLDESWHAVIVGPQYFPLERLGLRVHLLPAQRRIGNWLGIADVLCHPSDYESHCFSINEAWMAGVPVVSCDYLVNRLFDERHGPMMWLVPIRPEAARLAAAIGGGVRRAE
jgi:glycosyltransferase involved in cell wall biosynthesis